MRREFVAYHERLIRFGTPARRVRGFRRGQHARHATSTGSFRSAERIAGAGFILAACS